MQPPASRSPCTRDYRCRSTAAAVALFGTALMRKASSTRLSGRGQASPFDFSRGSANQAAMSSSSRLAKRRR